jgi:uncharacterized protein YaaQ
LAPSSDIDQLVVVIAASDQISDLSKTLNREKFFFTRIDSTSGLIQEATVCLLIGIDGTRHNDLMKLIEQCCQPHSRFIPTGFEGQMLQMQMPSMIEAQVGGALVYTMEIDYFEHL